MHEFDLARVIGCLVVKYDDRALGCQWEGELTKLPTTRSASSPSITITLESRCGCSDRSPRKTRVIRALEVDHNDDFSKSVEPLKRKIIGIFRVDSASYGQYSGKNVILRGKRDTVHTSNEV